MLINCPVNLRKPNMSRSMVLAATLLLGVVSIFRAEGPFINYTNANYVRALVLEGDSVMWAGGSGGVARWSLKDGSYIKYTIFGLKIARGRIQ